MAEDGLVARHRVDLGVGGDGCRQGKKDGQNNNLFHGTVVCWFVIVVLPAHLLHNNNGIMALLLCRVGCSAKEVPVGREECFFCVS